MPRTKGSKNRAKIDFDAQIARLQKDKGVFVNCDHNPQMMLYALGAYRAYG